MPGFLLWDLLSEQPWPFSYFHFSKIKELLATEFEMKISGSFLMAKTLIF